jgi:hypothetical protein
MALMVSRTLVSPLRAISAAMGRLAEGEPRSTPATTTVLSPSASRPIAALIARRGDTRVRDTIKVGLMASRMKEQESSFALAFAMNLVGILASLAVDGEAREDPDEVHREGEGEGGFLLLHAARHQADLDRLDERDRREGDRPDGRAGDPRARSRPPGERVRQAVRRLASPKADR